MAGDFGDFRDLTAWQKCRDLRVKFAEMCKGFPSEEKYSLKSQIIRASRSATACIAEGYGRYHYQENIQFCRQARGSLYELIDHVLVCEESGYTSEVECNNSIKEIKEAVKVLNGYIRYLQKQKEMKEVQAELELKKQQ